MVKITGDDRFRRRLQRVRSAATQRSLGAALFAGGQLVQVEAQLSITRGAVSGRLHAPSLPGEPPNQDTGVLANNIETAQISPQLVEVSSSAPYSAHLEFGTSKMAERPFMRPALAKKKREVAALIARALSAAAR